MSASVGTGISKYYANGIVCCFFFLAFFSTFASCEINVEKYYFIIW